MKLKTTTIKSICLAACGVMAMSFANAQEDFKPSGNLWGYTFGDFSYKTHNDTLGRGAGNVQYKGLGALSPSNATSTKVNNVPANSSTDAFQIRRAYLGYDYKFAPNLSANVVLAYEGTLPNNTDAGGSNTMYLKYCNLKWSNIFKNADLVIGQYATASFATPYGTEPLWGYRSIERTIMDMHNIDASSDLGLSLQGKAWVQGGQPDSLKPTFVGYALQVGNGTSAKPETDTYKKWRANLYLSTLDRKLTVGFYGDYVNTSFSPAHVYNMTLKAYASYATERFRLGFEVFAQTNYNQEIYQVYNTTTKALGAQIDTATGMQLGWSVFASAAIIKNKLNVFARYDMYNPDTKWNTDNVYTKTGTGTIGLTAGNTFATQQIAFVKQNFITAGFDWTPNSRFHIMPNIWYNAYSTNMSTNGPDATGNTLGSRAQKDYDMVYRLTFYYLFNGSKKVSNNGMY